VEKRSHTLIWNSRLSPVSFSWLTLPSDTPPITFSRTPCGNQRSSDFSPHETPGCFTYASPPGRSPSFSCDRRGPFKRNDIFFPFLHPLPFASAALGSRYFRQPQSPMIARETLPRDVTFSTFSGLFLSPKSPCRGLRRHPRTIATVVIRPLLFGGQGRL